MSDASIIPEFVSRKSLIERDGRTRAGRLFDEGTWKEVVGSFDGMESPWLLLQGNAPQADDGCIVIEETIGGMPAVAVALEGAFHVETQNCGLSLEEYPREGTEQALVRLPASRQLAVDPWAISEIEDME